MKNILLPFLFSLLPFSLVQAQFTVSGVLTDNCPEADSIWILEHDGVALRKINATPLKHNDNQATFEFAFKDIELGFYFLGIDPNNVKAMVLGEDNKVTITGNCNALPQATVTSPINTYFSETYAQLTAIDQRFSQEINNIRNARNDENKVNAAIIAMSELDKERIKLLNEASVKNTFIGSFVGLYTYLSYQNNKGSYNNEIEYFGNEYFGKVNLADPHYQRIPFLFDRVRQYTQTLTQVNQPNEVQKAFSERLLSMVPKGTRTHKTVLYGILNGYSQGNNKALFAEYGEQFLTLFGKENSDITEGLRIQVGQAKAFSSGGIAPDIAMQTPEGDTLSLHSLRGKVVLIDFWASWCGPCRKENPNVVKMYNKYKDKGFDVFGVSLDRAKDRWVNAIQADKLAWHHVSDLKGWQSAAAQLYGVRSIPQTLLIDQEGKIIARNLRGPSLEAKLKQLFGE